GNPGITRLSPGTLNIGGNLNAGLASGQYYNEGGTINIIGTINASAFPRALNSFTGSWNLLGGTINGVTFDITEGQSLVMTPSGGALNNVTVKRALTLPRRS